MQKFFTMKLREETVANLNQVSLLDVDKDSLGLIGFHLGNKNNRISYLQTCKTIYHFFPQPTVEKFLKDKITKLLWNIAYHRENAVKNMLDSYAFLLMNAGEVTDEAGRRIYGTPFQVALGAGDIKMARVIEFYFKQIWNGQEIKAKQFKEQFIENIYHPYDFIPLIKKISADLMVTEDNQTTEVTAQELENFRNIFMPKSTCIMQSGKHFDLRFIIDALSAYVTHFSQFQNDCQRSLYCRQVLGYLQRLLPVCHAQTICDELNLQMNVSKKSRPLRVNDLNFYDKNLGFNHYISLNSVRSTKPLSYKEAAWLLEWWKTYENTNQICLQWFEKNCRTACVSQRTTCS